MSSFFKVSKKKEDVAQGGNSKYINKSGIYPVTILAPFVNVGKGGSAVVDFFLEHEGQKQVLYGNLRISNNDGNPNVIGAKTFNQLAIIAGVEEVSEPEEYELPIGKNEAMKDCAVLTDLVDIDVLVRVQMEYGAHNGNITEKTVIKGFFRADDMATAEEIVNETEVGKGYEREQKYVDNVTYNDGVTPEQVAEWISAKRPKGTAGGGSPATGGSSEGTTKAKPSFGQKRSFGKK